MSSNQTSFDVSTRKKKKTGVFRFKYYQDQFTPVEQNTINVALNILSQDYSQQKEQLNYNDAKFLCHYFYSIFELSRRDYQPLDKELIQLYHDDSQNKEIINVIDIILNLKKSQPAMNLRKLGQYSKQDVTDILSERQIIAIEKSWSHFDEEENGYINTNQVDQLMAKLLTAFGVDKNHSDMPKILSYVESWKQQTSFYLFFNEFASLICEINEKYNLNKKRNSKTNCSCTIF